MEATLWGYSEAQIAQFGLSIGVSAFIVYMLFIVFNLAREAKAGKFGTFVLFFGVRFWHAWVRREASHQVVFRA